MTHPRSSVASNGAAIRAIRERSGLSRAQLVDLLADKEQLTVHISSLTNIELDRRNAGPQLAAALARVLKVPQVAILRDSPCATAAPERAVS